MQPTISASGTLGALLAALHDGNPEAIRARYVTPRRLQRELDLEEPHSDSPTSEAFSSDPFFQVALLLNHAGFFQEAAAHIGHAVAHCDPDDTTRWTFLKIYQLGIRSRQEKPREAIATHQEIVALCMRLPSEPQRDFQLAHAHRMLSQLHQVLGENRQAERCLRRGLEVVATCKEPLPSCEGMLTHELGMLAFRANRATEATAEFTAALRLKQDSGDSPQSSLAASAVMLGRALSAANRDAEAIERLQEGLTILDGGENTVESAEATYHCLDALVVANTNLGRTEEALKAARREVEFLANRPPLESHARKLAKARLDEAILTESTRLRQEKLEALIGLIQEAGHPADLLGVQLSAHQALVLIELSSGNMQGLMKAAKSYRDATKLAAKAEKAPPDILREARELDEATSKQQRWLRKAMREARFRNAFPKDELVERRMLEPGFYQDFLAVDAIAANREAWLIKFFPNVPPIEIGVLQGHGVNSRSILVRTTRRAFVAIRQEAIRQAADTLTELFQSSAFLSSWGLAASDNTRFVIVTPNGTEVTDSGAGTVDPFLQLVRRELLGTTFDYIICHELAHIVNGHLAYQQKTGSVSDISRQALEMDADIFGALMSLDAVSLRVGKSRITPPQNNLFMDLQTTIRAWSLSIYVALRSLGPMMVPAPGIPHGMHPPAVYRFLFAATSLDIWLRKHGETKSGTGLDHLLSAMREVEQHLVDARQLPPDFPSALTTFDDYRKALLAEWSQLRHQLDLPQF